VNQSISGTSALVILLACSAAFVLYTYLWAMSNRRPVHRKVVSGRPAAPYWHHPNGLQAERGIRALDDR
jgi:hypothetical protein